MILKNISILLCALLLNNSLHAEIVKTTQIEDIRKEVTDENTLVFFNIAEVLMDTETSLGTQAWRKFIRARLDSKLHDELTLYVFEHVPPKTPEPAMAPLIQELQNEGHRVFAFTSRGRHEWYASQVPDIDLITEKLLRQIGINFAHAHLNEQLSLLPVMFGDYYHDGIIYATNTKDKQELLQEILQKTGYKPSKIVFIDDKVDSLNALDKTFSSQQIPFVGYAYGRTAQEHANFDPMVAAIQLDWLITQGKVLSDAEATQLKNTQFANTNLDTYFTSVIEKWKCR